MRAVRTGSLQWAIGACLVAVVLLPSIAAVTIVAGQADRTATAQVLVADQGLAMQTARELSHHIIQQRAAVAALLAYPSLSTMAPDAQGDLLRGIAGAFPGLVLATFDDEGRPVARSDSLPGEPLAGDPLLDEARRSGSLVLDVRPSSPRQRWVLVAATPLHSPAGELVGLVTGSTELAGLAPFMDGTAEAVWVHLLDGYGRAIASWTPGEAGPMAGLSALPPVATTLTGDRKAGALSYTADGVELLAGYARVPETDWVVVVQQPKAMALASHRAQGDQALLVLLLVSAVALVAGVAALARLMAPLRRLVMAAEVLARGDGAAPLPSSRLSEVGRLSASFAKLRDLLAARTAEVERVVEERARLLAVEQSARVEAETAQRRLAFLAEASELLAGSLDYETTLQNVANLAVPYLADRCTVHLIDKDASVRPVAAACSDPSKISLLEELREEFPPGCPGPDLLQETLRTGKPQLIPRITHTWLKEHARNSRHLQLLQELGYTSYMCVPLMARERLLGALCFVSTREDRSYGSADLELAQELAHRAALALDNARLYREVQDTLRERQEFLLAVSHDLRNPLTVIKAWAGVLIDRATRHRSSPRDIRPLDDILRAADEMADLLNHLLDASRLQAGQDMELDLDAVDLWVTASQLVDRYRVTSPDHHLRIHGPGPGIVVGYWDALRIEQVLGNLISNAIKYSPAGRRIDIAVDKDDGEARVSVRDRGIGIPREAIQHIFEPFYRAPNAPGAGTTPRIGGLGLGLYIAQRLAQLHGGRIQVESEEGQGSTFTLVLPLRQAAGGTPGSPAHGLEPEVAEGSDEAPCSAES